LHSVANEPIRAACRLCFLRTGKNNRENLRRFPGSSDSAQNSRFSRFAEERNRIGTGKLENINLSSYECESCRQIARKFRKITGNEQERNGEAGESRQISTAWPT